MRNIGAKASVVCFIAMQHFSESLTDEFKMELMDIWEKTTETDVTRFPDFGDMTELDDSFMNATWHRAIEAVIDRKGPPESFYTKSIGFDGYYELYIRTATGPRTDECIPCLKQKNRAHPYCTQFASNLLHVLVSKPGEPKRTANIGVCDVCSGVASTELADNGLLIEMTRLEHRPTVHLPWIKNEQLRDTVVSMANCNYVVEQDAARKVVEERTERLDQSFMG